MKFSSPLASSIILCLGLAGPFNRAKASSTQGNDPSDISLVDFQSLLYSEINNEIEAVQEQQANGDGAHQDYRLRGRFLREEDVPPKAQDTWKKVVEHGWNMSQSFKNSKMYNGQTRNRHLQEHSVGLMTAYPFLVCSHSSRDNSAFQRLKPMLKRTGARLEDTTVVHNGPKKTCYHVSFEYETAQKLREAIVTNDDNEYYTIVPLTDLMKIQVDTMNKISQGTWTVPAEPMPNDWERLIRVGLSAGYRMHLNEDKNISIASLIIEDIKFLGQAGAKNRRRRLQKGKTSRASLSLSEVFSQTTAGSDNEETRNLRRANVAEPPGRHSDWRRALELGLEADHSCQTMFDSLDVSAHHDNKGFDLILNPDKNDGIEYKHNNNEEEEIGNDGIEYKHNNNEEEEDIRNDGIENRIPSGIDSSASNKHCVSSLILALSTHPLVLSVETEGPITTSDYESQWITQSKTQGKRPLKDLGIDGTNQVISIIDSGLDINHSYFGPTSPSVFNKWDYSQRKVVRYDHSMGGDTEERKGGHGTKVASAAAGALNNGSGEANGIAEGAKLHIIDFEKEGRIRSPPVDKLFKSMHDTDGTQARVANGSFMTTYRPYPMGCKFYDEALHDSFQGDLFVAGAGNSGFDETTMQSKQNTIGNPASCKNTLAVGASQSHGDRLAPNSKGMDYLATFSSRGPTYDGRMKPDLVAPGASVLTAFAHETGKTVQSYGTSFSAPVVAGNAALVRQYFEDGHLPCTWRSCKFDPSGSLVKAVLLNSAHSLNQVQVSQPSLEKKVLEEVREYDNNQGMGLIQLDQTLPIPGHNKFHAIVRNNKEISDRKFHDIYIRATPGKCWGTSYKHEFSATLTWYDPAGANGCAKCLINDLDISVHWITKQGKVKYGSEVFPNGSTHKDYENNVERVRFNMFKSRRYRIRIHAANLATATTKFSLMATGCFKAISNPAA